MSWRPCQCGRNKGQLFIFVDLWNGNTMYVFRDAISLVHVCFYSGKHLLFKVMTFPNPDLDSLLLLCLGRFKGIFLYTLGNLFFIFFWKLQSAISISNKHPRCCALLWHAFHSSVSLQGLHGAGQRNYLFWYKQHWTLCPSSLDHRGADGHSLNPRTMQQNCISAPSSVLVKATYASINPFLKSSGKQPINNLIQRRKHWARASENVPMFKEDLDLEIQFRLMLKTNIQKDQMAAL